ncbi:hypothetical protein NE236_09035 [Actinoallomurus purpureus]|uniref:hypothetical protein n=1 Tax=Actinoallomurus purpureus TaxID=478114 RepID=UPI002092723C|nr:hypothetical protein [Actinoallomurus purpureus]MCO6005127.1 hypothetical protein [Actinoallomurus purpureus]
MRRVITSFVPWPTFIGLKCGKFGAGMAGTCWRTYLQGIKGSTAMGVMFRKRQELLDKPSRPGTAQIA